MTEIDRLTDDELSEEAGGWRRRALRGDHHARGIAHELETALRRRSGSSLPAYDSLDLRPLDSRHKQPFRWRFWRRQNIENPTE